LLLECDALWSVLGYTKALFVCASTFELLKKLADG
jgi:hypothetical protein